MPIEVGITSFNSNESEYSFSVYMINARAVSGVQLDIDSNGVLNVDQVSGGRAEDNGFALHHNKNGRILGFSMSGGSIPASASKEKSENILFNDFCIEVMLLVCKSSGRVKALCIASTNLCISLGFTMMASDSKEKSENILFNVKASSELELNSSISINPIFADKSAKKMEFKSVPFHIGK